MILFRFILSILSSLKNDMFYLARSRGDYYSTMCVKIVPHNLFS